MSLRQTSRPGRRMAVNAAAAVTVLSATTGCTGDPPPAPSPISSAASTSSLSTGENESGDVAAALSALPTAPETLIASGANITPEQAREAFPAGTSVAAQPDSWAPDGTGSGGVMQVAVTGPGRPSATYLAIMVKESGKWRVLATVPVTETTPAGAAP